MGVLIADHFEVLFPGIWNIIDSAEVERGWWDAVYEVFRLHSGGKSIVISKEQIVGLVAEDRYDELAELLTGWLDGSEKPKEDEVS